MREIVAEIRGMTPYSQSRQFEKTGAFEKKSKESDDAYEARTWRGKMHVTEDGFVKIPADGIKQCIVRAARDWGQKIKGRGNKTWGALFEGGVMVGRSPVLNVKAEDVECESFMCDAQGNKGDRSSKRVRRSFPMIPAGWTAEVVITILNDDIQLEIVEQVLSKAGLIVGLGRYRPGKGGNNGMFVVTDFAEREVEEPTV
jgi:hypothetical protein